MICLLTNFKCLAQETVRTLRLQFIKVLNFRETCQWLKFPLYGLWAQSRVSPAVGLLPLASVPAYLRETGTGQQVAQLRERYTMMMIMKSISIIT